MFSNTLVFAQGSSNPSFSFTAHTGSDAVNVVNSAPNSLFVCNATLVPSGAPKFNPVGLGGNDTFDLYAGNATMVFVVTGIQNNTFNVLTGNGNSTFSLMSGANSSFNIVQNNYNGTLTLTITGGVDNFVNETSAAPVAATYYSINLGFNSTVDLGSLFSGNQTAINVVF